MHTWIKICATTSLEDARAAVEAGADAVGFVFADSPRRVTVEIARAISSNIPASVEKIGVFVNHPREFVAWAAEDAGLTGVQLHGDEDDDYLNDLSLRLRALSPPPLVIKTLNFTSLLEAGLPRYLQTMTVDRVLLDSGSMLQRGGTGRAFDWNVAAGILKTSAHLPPVILAGGLNPGNVTQAIQALRPWGVDVVSGVEAAPGKKDPEKLAAFVRNVRAALAQMAGESR